MNLGNSNNQKMINLSVNNGNSNVNFDNSFKMVLCKLLKNDESVYVDLKPIPSFQTLMVQ